MNANQSFTPVEFPGMILRPAQITDSPHIYDLLRAIAAADGSITTVSLQDIKNLFNDSWSNPQVDSLLALALEGKIAGLAWVLLDHTYTQQVANLTWSNLHAEIWCNVHPASQDDYPGLDVFLLQWANERAAIRLYDVPHSNLQRFLLTNSWEDQVDKIIMLEGHGYKPVRYFARMYRDLGQSIPDEPLPAGLRLCTFSSELSEPLREAYNEVFKNDWNYQYASPQDWQRAYIGRLDFFPELTFLAMDGDRIAGFSINHVHQTPDSKREGYITYIGTLPEWRGRCVASALLCASLRAFQSQGLAYAALGVDTDNPNEAFGLYIRLGFTVNRRLVQYAKPV
jgi:ribosomal protein S18 acetylase RimI-like enzyme